MKIEVLDHGYIELIETWGSDERIVEAARQSTQKGFLGWGPKRICRRCGGPCEGQVTPRCAADDESLCIPIEQSGDEKLLRTLWTNQHSTPFEFAGAIIEVQAPIAVFREWHRHRTQSYSEASARYTPIPQLDYLPTVERLLMVNVQTANRQAGAVKGAPHLDEFNANLFLAHLEDFYANAEVLYQNALKAGIPKELARLCMPVGRYSRMRASANLRNWMAFLTLREESHAQWEIRQYAQQMHKILSEKFPRTIGLFEETQKL